MIAEGDPSDQGDEASGASSDDSATRRWCRRSSAWSTTRELREGAQRRGLDVMNVTWEDTGRAQGSSLGPEHLRSHAAGALSRTERGQVTSTALMPVIRFPNFTDRTGDVAADKFFVRVGQPAEPDGACARVPLTDVLREHQEASRRGPGASSATATCSSPRDTHFLVSAQAVFLPIPKKGKAEFNPVRLQLPVRAGLAGGAHASSSPARARA